MDRQTFEQIELQGRQKWLEGIGKDLHNSPGCTNVLQILERAIIDTKLRSSVEKYTSQILNLL